MTLIVTSEFAINKIAAPNLPLAPQQWNPQYQDQFSNVLRLYFNRLDDFIARLSTSGAIDPGLINNPNALFFSTQDQTLAVVDTGYPITFNQTYLSNNVALQSPSTSKIEVSVDGVYNFQLSCQLKSTNASAKDVHIWIKRGTTTIGYSSRIYTLEGSNNNFAIAWSFNIDLAAGEFIEMYWGANNTNVILDTTTAVAPYPAAASAVMAVSYVARLPDPRPTPPP
jgi:hypothetical protein